MQCHPCYNKIVPGPLQIWLPHTSDLLRFLGGFMVSLVFSDWVWYEPNDWRPSCWEFEHKQTGAYRVIPLSTLLDFRSGRCALCTQRDLCAADAAFRSGDASSAQLH